MIITIAVVGFIVWLILQVPMPQVFRNVIIAVVVFALIVWILQVVGIDTGFRHLHLN